MKLRLLLLLVLFLAFSSASEAQNSQRQFTYSHFNMLGVANDTVFNARSTQMLVVLNYSTGELRLQANADNLNDDNPLVQGMFDELSNPRIVVTANPGSIYQLYQRENNGKSYPFSGWMEWNGERGEVTGSYFVSKMAAANRTNTHNTNQLPLRMTMTVKFDPNKFNLAPPGILANPMEIDIPNAFVNRIN